MHWNDLRNSKKCCIYNYSFIKEKDKLEAAKEGHIKWSLGGSKCKASGLLPVESWTVLGPSNFHVQQTPEYRQSKKLNPAFVSSPNWA